MEKCTKGYFEFDTRQDGLYLTVYPPQQGEPALDAGEVLYYIEKKNGNSNPQKHSRSIYAEATTEMCQKQGYFKE